MEAGRELDALVAEKVMGCKVTKILDYGVAGNYRYRCDCNGYSPIETPPHASDSFDNDIKNYSDNIAEAWEVVEELRSAHWNFKLCCHHGEWYVFLDHDTYGNKIRASTAPLAICLAALKAVGVEA